MARATTPLTYNPYEKPLADETERTIRKHYDDTYASFLKSSETRIAFQLSLRYFLDANPVLGSLVTGLTGNEIVLLDTEEPDNAIHYLFVGNCIPHQNIKADQFSNLTLSPTQTLVLASNATLSESDLEKIQSFVSQGGLVISFNKAVQIIAQAFPNTLSFKNGESTLDKRIELNVEETDDVNLFLGLRNASENKKAIRLAGVRRFEVNPTNENVRVLVRETQPSKFPIAVKISHGQGSVFHFIHVGTDEVLELRSREKGQFYCKQVEDGPNINLATKQAWKTALQCTHWGSFYLAISLLPFFDIIFGIINKYNRS